jgi:GNAT superfamily N-acetyltransferase
MIGDEKMSKQSSNLEKENQILLARSPADIANCFSIFQELRPKLKDKEAFIDQIQRQIKHGYILSYTRDDDEIGACMGFRMFETLAWGRILYIDDLITREKSRRKGLAGSLLTHAVEQGRLAKCAEIHLDTGHHRHDAHRLYLSKGFTLNCHHLALVL